MEKLIKMCQKIENQTQNININVSNPMTKRTVILAQFVGICPNCKHRNVISAKKVNLFKLDVCRACHRRTWLRMEGKLKYFGHKAQFAKISWFNSEFAQFWLNLEANQ